MHNPLIQKLDRIWGLEPSDRVALAFGEPRFVQAHHDILAPSREMSHFSLVVSGIACRYKMMADGRRAILAFLLPGDFTTPHIPEPITPDFGVIALTPSEIVEVPCAQLQALVRGNPRLARALSWCAIVDSSIQRAWLANISQFAADRRMAHLLCELRQRLATVSLADGQSFRLPLTQQELADALGLSTVHVNRVMQHLKELGLIRVMDRTVFIPDLSLLEEFAEFDADYLHPQSQNVHQQSVPAASIAGSQSAAHF